MLSAEGAFGTLFSLLLCLEFLLWGMLVGGVLITLSIILAEYGETELIPFTPYSLSFLFYGFSPAVSIPI